MHISFFAITAKRREGEKEEEVPLELLSRVTKVPAAAVSCGEIHQKTNLNIGISFYGKFGQKNLYICKLLSNPMPCLFFPLAKEGKKPSGEKGKRRKVTVAEKRRTTKLLRKLHLSSCKSFPPSAAKSRVSSSLLLLLLLFQKKSGEGKTFLPRSRQWKASSSFWIKKPSPFLDNIFHGDGRPPSFSQTFARRRLFLRY